ncbi:unnamed protein product [Arctia plantaginis]|uniref:Uncharacterized protein n=1 Tax=Arctia plantaginis TaxID=874455 RepID=A0A8S0Z5Q2_ARCPL|nr:unnamed protein product [Arctia plantaginis]CAB3228270.1 unnamed protein product [Arctia plantaginis]
MSKLKLKYCCYCGDLRTGSVVIANVNLVRDILFLLISITMLTLTGTRYALWLDRVMIPVFGILLVVNIVNVIMDIVLLIGIHKYKVGYLKTNFIFNVIEMVVASVLILTLCITSELPGLIALCLVFLGFHMYNLMIIRSYYLKMDDPSNKPAIYDSYTIPIPAEYIVNVKKDEIELFR